VRLAPATLALALACGGATERAATPTEPPSEASLSAADPAPRPEPPSDEALADARARLAAHALHRVPIGDAPVRGPEDAPITIVAFTDFECPYCARAVTILEAVRARYRDRVRLVLRHNPLPYHEHAKRAHAAAEEARAQGGDEAFWAMHDRLFAFRDLSVGKLRQHARALDLDLSRFELALEDGRHDERLEADLALGRTFGVSGTPTFFVNGRKLTGAKPPEAFAALIDPLLVEAQARLAAGTPAGALYDAITADGATEAVEAPRGPRRVEVPRVPEHAPRRGAAEPELVVQVFSDFECPYCRRLVPLLTRLERDFPEVQIVWRHFPLTQHEGGRIASEVGAAVHAQRGDAGFWAFHDALFAAGRPLDRARILAVAGSVEGVEVAPIRTALDERSHRLEVARDVQAGRRVGVRSTPTILVGDRMIRGARSYLDLEEAVDLALDDG
jgi:protein-disulfide isomerase